MILVQAIGSEYTKLKEIRSVRIQHMYHVIQIIISRNEIVLSVDSFVIFNFFLYLFILYLLCCRSKYVHTASETFLTKKFFFFRFLLHLKCIRVDTVAVLFTIVNFIQMKNMVYGSIDPTLQNSILVIFIYPILHPYFILRFILLKYEASIHFNKSIENTIQ